MLLFSKQAQQNWNQFNSTGYSNFSKIQTELSPSNCKKQPKSPENHKKKAISMKLSFNQLQLQ